MVTAGHSPREAYEAVPQLQARGEAVLQNIRKQARKLQAEDQAEGEAQAVVAPRGARRPTKKMESILPKGKRLRSDQVDAIALQRAAKRAKRSAAHKQATTEAAKARNSGRMPNGKLAEIVNRVNARTSCPRGR